MAAGDVHHLVPAGTGLVRHHRAAPGGDSAVIGDILWRPSGRRGSEAAAPIRLDVAEAERIAHAAAAGSPLIDRLVLRGAWVEDGRLAWHYRTPTRGSGLVVRVDGATGEAAACHRHGRRLAYDTFLLQFFWIKGRSPSPTTAKADQ